MSIQKYSRIELALNQFETAVALFFAGKDYFSVITLTGAADVIFCQAISRMGKENFTDLLIKEEGLNRTRHEVGKEVNDLFFINDIKHLDPGEDDYIQINPYESAFGAIFKGISNYNLIPGRDQKVVDDFLAWVRTNLDPEIYNIHCDPNWTPKK